MSLDLPDDLFMDGCRGWSLWCVGFLCGGVLWCVGFLRGGVLWVVDQDEFSSIHPIDRSLIETFIEIFNTFDKFLQFLDV